MSLPSEMVELPGHVAALKVAIVTEMMLSAAKDPGFNPVEFSAARRSLWGKVGRVFAEGGSDSIPGFEKGLHSLGELLTMFARPVDEGMRGGMGQ